MLYETIHVAVQGSGGRQVFWRRADPYYKSENVISADKVKCLDRLNEDNEQRALLLMTLLSQL